MGTIIKEQIEIKENTIIGAHSYVNKNCAKNLIFYGSPARKVKKDYLMKIILNKQFFN